MQIPLNEFRADLLHWVAQAQAGEVIEITSHDQPVARVIGIPSAQPAGLTRLKTLGAVQWVGGKPNLLSPIQLADGGSEGTPLSSIVLEERG
jgi:prevent-host-death family protein